MAATNRVELLDPALTRAGWFDRIVEIGLPTLQERRDIYELYLWKIKIIPDEKISDQEFYETRL